MINEDIIDKLSEKYKLPPEQIKLVINSFWNGFRYYLVHPLEAKDGICIHNFLSFYMSKKKIINYMERLKLIEFQRPPTADTSKIEFYEELLNNKVKYERQKSKPLHDQRSSKGAPSEGLT